VLAIMVEPAHPKVILVHCHEAVDGLVPQIAQQVLGLHHQGEVLERVGEHIHEDAALAHDVCLLDQLAKRAGNQDGVRQPGPMCIDIESCSL